MTVIWSPNGIFRRVEYENEADLESAILEVQHRLFGRNRFYLDVKKRIGVKGSIQNVPDGYLLDLSGAKPRLYVVENELQEHDPLRHIAVQILQFSLSFEAEPLAVKKVLLHALQNNSEARNACESYAANNGFRNVDHLLEHLVFESPFSALVVIDAMPEDLESVLSEKFRFGVEVLELAKYKGPNGQYVYRFEPFLEDLIGEPTSSSVEPRPIMSPEDIDTVVVPAHEDGLQEVFLEKNCWYSVRIRGAVRSQIKYIAVYQVDPVSAITYVAPVKSIEPWKDSGKVVLYFTEPAKPIGPIPLVKGGKVKALQNLRYTTHERLIKAKTLDEVFSASPPEDAAAATDSA
jgi:hypothetical protein